MRLHIHFQTGDIQVNEIIAGETPEAIVAEMQQRVATKAGFLVGAFVRNMTPLQFAQEATRRFNAATKDNSPLPNSCADFVQFGLEKNFATMADESAESSADGK